MSHIRASHVARMSESCLINERLIRPHSYVLYVLTHTFLQWPVDIVVSHQWKTYTSSLIRVIRPHSYELYVLTHTCLQWQVDIVVSHKWKTYTSQFRVLDCIIWVSHVAHMNESRHLYGWFRSQVMSHVCTSHVTYMSLFILHIWMSHVAHMNEPCYTYEWVMSHIWMSHVTHMNESYHTYESGMSHVWMSHVTLMNQPYHTYEGPMPPSTFLIVLYEFVVLQISTICTSHVTYWYMYESCHTYQWVTSRICMSLVAHMNESCHIYK